METCPSCKQPVKVICPEGQLVYENHPDRDGEPCDMSGEPAVTVTETDD